MLSADHHYSNMALNAHEYRPPLLSRTNLGGNYTSFTFLSSATATCLQKPSALKLARIRGRMDALMLLGSSAQVRAKTLHFAALLFADSIAPASKAAAAASPFNCRRISTDSFHADAPVLPEHLLLARYSQYLALSQASRRRHLLPLSTDDSSRARRPESQRCRKATCTLTSMHMTTPFLQTVPARLHVFLTSFLLTTHTATDLHVSLKRHLIHIGILHPSSAGNCIVHSNPPDTHTPTLTQAALNSLTTKLKLPLHFPTVFEVTPHHAYTLTPRHS